MEFAVANIPEIQWAPDPLNNVKIPESKKDIIQNLIGSYLNRGTSNSFDDTMEGKGCGLIFLL